MQSSKKPASQKSIVNQNVRDAYQKAQPSISGDNVIAPDIRNDFANYRRKVEIRNPQGLAIDYKAQGDRSWTRTSRQLITLELATGKLEIKEPYSANRRISLEGSEIVVAPKAWDFNVSGRLALFEKRSPRYTVDREGRRRIDGYDTVSAPDPDATQVLEIGHAVDDQLRLPVASEILTSKFGVLGTLCMPVPVSGQGPFSSNPNYTADVLTHYNAIKANLNLLSNPRLTPAQSVELFSNVVRPLQEFCSGNQARVNRNEMLTYEQLKDLARTRGANGASYFAAEDRSDEDGYWSLPLHPVADIRHSSNLIERAFHENGVSNEVFSLFTSGDRVNYNGVTLEWNATPAARKYKRIPLLSTTLVERAVGQLSVKIKRDGSCGFKVSEMHDGEELLSSSIALDCPEVTVDLPLVGNVTFGANLGGMSDIDFTFETKIFVKDDHRQSISYGRDISSAVRDLGDDEFILYLKARKNGVTDLEVNLQNVPVPNPDFRVTEGSFGVALKLKAGWSNIDQSDGTRGQSLYFAALPVRSPEQSGLLDAEGIEFISDDGVYDNAVYNELAAQVRSQRHYALRDMFREEAGKALTEFISKAWNNDPEAKDSGQYYNLMDNIRTKNGLLQECVRAPAYTCINLEEYVSAINFPLVESVPGPFGPIRLNISGAKLAEGLIGTPIRALPLRFVKSISCKPRASATGCYDVLGLAIEPKSPLASNKLWDSIIPFPKDEADIIGFARQAQ